MSLSFNLNNSSQRALDTAILGCVRDAVEYLADKHGFSCEDALKEMNLVKSTTAKKPAKPKFLKATIPLPFCGTLLSTCCGIRVNHGLHSQCSNAKEICEISGETLDYCKTCNKQAKSNENGTPNAGDIRARLSGDWSPSKGKLVNFGNVMDKLNISREKAEEEAAKLGLTIPEEQFEVVKGRRGRPKSDAAASSSDDEKPKKPRGRPKKEKKVISSSAGDDLISSLVAQAAAETTDSSSDSDRETEKAAKLAEKEAKKKAREETKAAKLAEQEANKKAREEAKAAKEAEKAAKLAEKAAKLAEKEAKKKARQEAKAAKAAKKKSKDEKTAGEPDMFLADLGTPSSPKCEIHDISLKAKADELTAVENKALQELKEEAFGSDSDGELEMENSESDDEEENESINATIREINGTKYVMAKDTMHLYDFESHEPLNKYYDEDANEIKDLPDDDEEDDDE